MEYKDSLNDIVKAAHRSAIEHGFYEDFEARYRYLRNAGMHELARADLRSFTLEQLSKIASEVGEAVQAIQRKDVNSEELRTELADIIIRTADLAGYLDIDLGKAVHEKMMINKRRARLHGKLC